MDKPVLNFTYVYPDTFNLHGDRGNVLAFEKVCGLCDVEFSFERVDAFDQKIDFENTDVMFFSVGELRSCAGVVKHLQRYKEEFSEYVRRGKTLICIGTSIALFTKKTERMDGTQFSGLGLCEAVTRERKITYSNDEVFTTDFFGEEEEIVGGQIQMVDLILDDVKDAFGKVSYGYGNRHETDEGYVKNNFIFTNSLGPVFVKNPWFAYNVIKTALQVKGVQLQKKMPEFALEHRSNEEIKKFIELKIEKYDSSRLE